VSHNLSSHYVKYRAENVELVVITRSRQPSIHDFSSLLCLFFPSRRMQNKISLQCQIAECQVVVEHLTPIRLTFSRLSRSQSSELLNLEDLHCSAPQVALALGNGLITAFIHSYAAVRVVSCRLLFTTLAHLYSLSPSSSSCIKTTHHNQPASPIYRSTPLCKFVSLQSLHSLSRSRLCCALQVVVSTLSAPRPSSCAAASTPQQLTSPRADLTPHYKPPFNLSIGALLSHTHTHCQSIPSRPQWASRPSSPLSSPPVSSSRRSTPPMPQRRQRTTSAASRSAS
jgi:hypothetical protein